MMAGDYIPLSSIVEASPCQKESSGSLACLETFWLAPRPSIYWPNHKILHDKSVTLARKYYKATSCPRFRRQENCSCKVRCLVFANPGKITGLGTKPIKPPASWKRTMRIQMPSIHPCVDKYGNQPFQLPRVYDMNMEKPNSAVDIALTGLTGQIKTSKSENQSRFTFCMVIPRETNSRWTQPGADAAFRGAKQDLRNFAKRR
ncbi:hypothetical protein B0J12DRAFT_147176 [Macrophomina phaseolina]|uniref:Uncharacterized protein n=1 Tax=Macrophomina phaseolina TaxID=35725 RepID=A0ABQ8G657_9PEZI|nr:hypothetical protein B0J12DRAFT_147176 [Macrophomina phaseolina]